MIFDSHCYYCDHQLLPKHGLKCLCADTWFIAKLNQEVLVLSSMSMYIETLSLTLRWRLDKQFTLQSKMEDNGDVVDGPEDDASDTIPSFSGQEHNEPDSNATLSERVFHAAKDGMALTLFALLADQARPQQVLSRYYW